MVFDDNGAMIFVSVAVPNSPINAPTMTRQLAILVIIKKNITEETRQVMNNIKGILNAAHLEFNNVVKASIFLKDLNDFEEINVEYARYFSENNAPARECIEVSRLPKDVNVEISVIAAR